MRAQPIDSEPSSEAATDDATAPHIAQPVTEAAIMTLLLSGGHEGPWTRAELELEVSASPLNVGDVLAALRGSGLVNLQGELVIASRAARRMDELEL
jgi:hypothetical protein